MGKISPKSCQIEITNHCNSKCSMCNIWKDQPKIDINPEIIETLPKCIKEVNLTGGEPYMYTNLNKVLKTLLRRNIRVVISSNGFLTEKIIKTVTPYRNNKNLAIRISIDGMYNKHEEIRGTPLAKNAFETIKQLKDLGIKDLGIAYTISEYNIGELYKVYKFAKSLNVQFVISIFHNSDTYFKNENIKQSNFEAEIPSLEKIRDEYLRSWNIKKLGRAFFTNYIIKRIKGNVPDFQCNAMRDTIFINNKGILYPCIVSSLEVANLNKHHLEDVFEFKQGKAKEGLAYVQNCKQKCLMCAFTVYVRAHKLSVLWWVIKNKFFKRFDQNE